MPTYDYRCTANGQVVEVNHRMSEQPHTWGELCALTGLEIGEIPAEAPVEKLLSAAGVVSSRALKNPEPPCASGPCCGGGQCGFN